MLICSRLAGSGVMMPTNPQDRCGQCGELVACSDPGTTEPLVCDVCQFGDEPFEGDPVPADYHPDSNAMHCSLCFFNRYR